MPKAFIDGAMLSHTGLVRDHNEDAVAYWPPKAEAAGRASDFLALVADGMGGHAAGEVASAIAARTIPHLYYEIDEPVPNALAKAFNVANKLIYEQSRRDPECNGMGTTCTTIVFRDDRLWLGHVGDSRAYLVRGEEIYQLSNDHSLVASLVQEGTMTPAEAAVSPQRNVILRALGTKPEVEIQIWKEGMTVDAGDVVVLCSDGLNDLVDDETISKTATGHPPYDACQALINTALARGGRDNVSVGVFKVSEPAPVITKKTEPITRTIHLGRLFGEQS